MLPLSLAQYGLSWFFELILKIAQKFMWDCSCSLALIKIMLYDYDDIIVNTVFIIYNYNEI